jgi:uncharacterized protein YjcR
MPPKIKINYDKVQELYDEGLIDAEIAEKQNCSSRWIFEWRRRNKLPPNSRIHPSDFLGVDTKIRDRESLFCDKEFLEKITGCKVATGKKKRFWNETR